MKPCKFLIREIAKMVEIIFLSRKQIVKLPYLPNKTVKTK